MSFKYDFTRLKNRTDLVSLLEIDERILQDVLDFDPSEFEQPETDTDVQIVSFSHFIRHEIPKKNPRRGSRIVWE